MRKKRTIHLFGSLAKKLGTQKVDLYCEGWADLYRAMCSAFRGFREYAGNKQNYLLLYKVNGGEAQAIDEVQIHQSFGDCDELCMCIEVKANDPASSAAAVASYFSLSGVAYAVVYAVVYVAVVVAVAYTASSILQSLADVPTGSETKETAKNESNIFSGVANTVQQGVMVPWIFGEFEVGGVIIGSQIDSVRTQIT